MPDIWTKYPDVVRRILTEAGFKCGVEPQILTRKASETCQFAKANFLGEIYIHQMNSVPSNNTFFILALSVAIIIIVILTLMLLKKSRKKKLKKSLKKKMP